MNDGYGMMMMNNAAADDEEIINKISYYKCNGLNKAPDCRYSGGVLFIYL